jgi:hypothetical protein
MSPGRGPTFTVVDADAAGGNATAAAPRLADAGLRAVARPVNPTGLAEPQPLTSGAPVAAEGNPLGRYGDTKQANDGGICVTRVAVTVTVSGRTVGDVTSTAVARPKRVEVLTPLTCAVAV